MSDEENRSLVDATSRFPKLVVHRAFAGEMVVLDLRSGRYHGLNPTGGHIFELLAKEATVRDVVDKLAQEYERPTEELEQHVSDFCRALLKQGLVETNGYFLD